MTLSRKMICMWSLETWQCIMAFRTYINDDFRQVSVAKCTPPPPQFIFAPPPVVSISLPVPTPQVHKIAHRRKSPQPPDPPPASVPPPVAVAVPANSNPTVSSAEAGATMTAPSPIPDVSRTPSASAMSTPSSSPGTVHLHVHQEQADGIIPLPLDSPAPARATRRDLSHPGEALLHSRNYTGLPVLKKCLQPYCLFATNKCNVLTWRLGGDQRATYTAPEPLGSVLVTPDGTRVYAGAANRPVLYCWDVESKEQLAAVTLPVGPSGAPPSATDPPRQPTHLCVLRPVWIGPTRRKTQLRPGLPCLAVACTWSNRVWVCDCMGAVLHDIAPPPESAPSPMHICSLACIPKRKAVYVGLQDGRVMTGATSASPPPLLLLLVEQAKLPPNHHQHPPLLPPHPPTGLFTPRIFESG
ncbi:hypothetical protein PAPYR_5167 [Paratrimastix pyriformis]|uniref:Uncharacterized protein n=1 Tax=Paratrimastix pyriformis TaxID=342808 RepID=A0ABQ8UNK7_9EUKA|nr:hypothetical protein PAPYR_5167 [Paratrimastix pyriformis]